MNIAVSDIVTAFDNFAIGSKVIDAFRFYREMQKAVESYDFTQGKIPGQGFVPCPGAISYVSAGDGLRTSDPNDYIPALHRGHVGLYLKREQAGPVISCNLVVYTIDAYENDPDVSESEVAQFRAQDATHVLVAVLASSCERSALGPYRFVHNLAGGNNEALAWTADEIRDKAREILGYANQWAPVAG